MTDIRSAVGASSYPGRGILIGKSDKAVALLAVVNDGKINLMAVCGKDAIAKGVKAGDIIKTLAPICGGKGGGKPETAMGGGNDVMKLDNAMAELDDFVAQKLGL